MTNDRTAPIQVRFDAIEVENGMGRIDALLVGIADNLNNVAGKLSEIVTLMQPAETNFFSSILGGAEQLSTLIGGWSSFEAIPGAISKGMEKAAENHEDFSIFKALIPGTTDVTETALKGVLDFARKVKDASDGIVGSFVDAVSFEGSDVVTGVKDTAAAISKYVSDVKSAIPTDGIWEAMFPGIKSHIAESVEGVKLFSSTVKAKIPEIVDSFKSGFANLRGGLTKVIKDPVGAIGGLFKSIGGLFKSIGGFFSTMQIGLPLAIIAIVAAIILLIQNFDKIKAALLPIWEEHLKPLWDQMSLFLASVGENLRIIWESLLKPVIDWILSIFEPAVMAVIEVVMGALGGIVGFLSGIISAVMSILDGIIQFIAGVFSGDWQRAWDGIVKVFQGIFEGIAAIAKGVVNTIITVLNALIGAIYSAVAGVVNGLGGIVEAVGNIIGQDWGFSMPSTPPQIPYLAQGAVLPANRPFLAVVGDQKHGTNVEAPLSTIQAAVAEVMARQGTGDINITFTGDLAQLGRVLKPVIERENRRVGGSLAKGVY